MRKADRRGNKAVKGTVKALKRVFYGGIENETSETRTDKENK